MIILYHIINGLLRPSSSAIDLELPRASASSPLSRLSSRGIPSISSSAPAGNKYYYYYYYYYYYFYYYYYY